MRRGVAAGLLAALAAGGATAGQAQAPDPPARAFDLERRGRHPEALQLYRDILAGRPGDVTALLGLERSLTALNRLPEMTRETAEALAHAPPSAAVFGIAIRVYTAAGWADSARRVVERWAAIEPGSEGPFQEWGAAALAARDRPQARAAYRAGRARLGGGALAGELAQLATIEGDFTTAVTEWMLAIGQVPGYRAAAVSMLSQVAAEARPGVLRLLGQERSAAGERVAAALTIRWGDPVGGVRRVERALPLAGEAATDALQEVLDELRGQRGREALMARGIALELLGRQAPAQATRFWLEAAQAYADAGDQQSARRMLSRLAGDPGASGTLAASAASTLVSVLVAEGRLDEASRQFAQLGQVLAPEERQDLARRVAEGWIRQGDLGRAEALVAQDSTVEGLAIRGRIRLFLGDLRGAAEALRVAGPFAGQREAAVSRTGVLSLLQVIEADSVPPLGAALLALERGDTAAAAGGLERVGGALPPAAGGAEVLLLAGILRAAGGAVPAAEALFRRVADFGVPASAAQAQLELARVLLGRRERPEAMALLEHLLVTYPTSAVAPQARRLLDEARGAVPPAASRGAG